jgi:outer membrane immunogenic protein
MFFGAAVAATALLATPAAAQNAGNKVGGGRFEVLVGYDRVGFDLEDAFDINDSMHMDGVLYGIGLGYDFPVTQAVSLGVDLEASDATTKRKEIFSGLVDGSNVVGSARISAGRDLYAGARLTVAVSPRVNVYVKGGYTNARLSAGIKGTIDGVVVDESDSANGDGFRAGLGAQYAVSGNTYVGLEYRYSNYESDFTRNQVAATFGLKF